MAKKTLPRSLVAWAEMIPVQGGVNGTRNSKAEMVQPLKGMQFHLYCHGGALQAEFYWLHLSSSSQEISAG